MNLKTRLKGALWAALWAAISASHALAQYPSPHLGTGTVVDGLSASVLPLGASTSRALSARFSDTFNVRDYGAKGDGITDDTAAFRAAIAAAVNTVAPRNSNTGIKIYVPCGKYALSSELTVTTGPNAAIGFYGDTASCTELQWNTAVPIGLDFELPQQTQTGPQRSTASTAGGLGVAVDVEHLSLVNNAPGNGYFGTALAIHQPIPTNANASGGPDQTISDVRWYALAPGLGGSSVDGQGWMIGIEATETPDLHIDHVTGTQWGNSNFGFGPTGSIGIHLVSTGASGVYFEQQVWLTNYSQQGAYRGVVVDGHNLQGLYASGLFLLQNWRSIDWEAPTEDASASFTLTNSSINGQQDGIFLANVKQVMISNTEILNGGSNGLGAKVVNDYHGIYDTNADDVMISNNVLIPACSACTYSLVASGHKGYGIFILHHASDDGQGSVIHGNSIAYGDVGIHVGGSQIHVTGNNIASGALVPLEDASGGATHPVFGDNEWGQQKLTVGEPIDQGVQVINGLTSGAATNLALPQSTGAVIACSGTLASATFNLPTSPVQSQKFHVASECTITAFTLTPQPTTAGTTVAGSPGTITPSTPLTFLFDAQHNVWVRW